MHNDNFVIIFCKCCISKGGYLYAAIRWTFVEHLHIELDFNNLLFDDEKVDYFQRELKITYIEYF